MTKKARRSNRAGPTSSAAIVTIYRAGEMTPQGRHNVAAWLRRHAHWLVKSGRLYSKRFTGRYLYPAAKPRRAKRG